MPTAPEPKRNIWVVARIQPTSKGLDLHLQDERGLRLAPRGNDARRRWRIQSGTELVRVPAKARQFLRDAYVRHLATDQQRLGASRIPIFVQPPPDRSEEAWELGFPTLAPQLVRAVTLARENWTVRAPFNLPIDVLAVGNARRYLARLEQTRWYRSQRAVREHGLIFENTERRALAGALRERGRDVVVALERDWPSVLSAVGEVSLGDAEGMTDRPTRPRLVILIVHSTIDLPVEVLEGTPDGTALLLVPATALISEHALYQFFFGIFHNQPFHAAIEKCPRSSPPVRLIADPATNQSMRVSDALTHLQELTVRLRHGVSAGDTNAFIKRAGKNTAAWRRIERALRAAQRTARPIVRAVDLSDRLTVSFTHESSGLVPMSHALSGLRTAHYVMGDVEKRLAEIARNPATAAELARAQERYVDVGMEIRDAAINAFLPTDRYASLLTDSSYRLRVHIGHPAPNSLMVGPRQSIDPLLPDLPETEPGYDLDVVVFEKDFKLTTDRIRRLLLPRLGGSMPVHFGIRTPPSAMKAAELRINIYYQNHLVQAFLLQAAVTTKSRKLAEQAVTVKLDVATSASFGNLRELKKRIMAIGVNANPDGATHEVMIKKDGHASHPLKLTEKLSGDQIEVFRQLLKDSTEDANERPYFPTRPDPGSPPPAQFEPAIRELARFGRKLYDGVFQKAPEMKTDLDELRAKNNEVIQVIRHHANGVLPWPVVYDYFPPSVGHKKTAPVCRGAPVPNAPLSVRDGLEGVRGCPHNPGREVYCIDGFWGFRHQIEQLTSGGVARNSALKLDTAAAAHAVCLATGITQSYGKNLAKALTASWGKRFLSFPPPAPPAVIFADLMWNARSRPAVLVLLSHLENPQDGDAEIYLVPAAQPPFILTADLISQLVSARSMWKEEPSTLVLLMACESATTSVGTLNNFMEAFKAAGAAAIVGTEVPVYASLAARFAEDLITALKSKNAQGKPTALGEAMRNVALRLLGEGNPLGLVFTYCGSADLELV